MENNNTCSEISQNNRVTSLSEEEIKKISITWKNPEWIELPKFWTFEDFKSSDFFRRYYDLEDKSISYDRDMHLLQVYKIDESIFLVQKLQRALVVLWYLDVDVLEGNYCTLEMDDTFCLDNTITDDPFLYFWTFGVKTMKALHLFQTHSGISSDFVVWTDTKTLLYQALFHTFHSKEKEICIVQSQGNRADLLYNVQ